MPDEERSLEHQRATYAYRCINEISALEEEKQKKYRTAALSCSALIQKSGLMQTLAFYLGKKGLQEILASHILQWIVFYSNDGNPANLFEQLMAFNDEMLMWKTMEAQALVKWLKRFSEGKLKRDEDEEEALGLLAEEDTEEGDD